METPILLTCRLSGENISTKGVKLTQLLRWLKKALTLICRLAAKTNKWLIAKLLTKPASPLLHVRLRTLTPMMAEKRTHPHGLSWAKDQQRMQTTDNEASDECINGAGPDTTETMSASAISEEESCPHLPSIRQDQNKCNATPVTPEEISHPFSQDPQSDQMQNNGDFSEFPVGGSPAVAQYLNPPAWPIHLPSFERSEPRDNVGDTAPSPGVGRESGISSMAVSPDLPRAGSEFGENVADAMQDWDPHWEERAEAQNGLFADDVAAPVIHENTAGWLFGPYPPRPCQQPHGEHTDGAKCDSFAANEDAFGHEIEDGYHRALERLMAQISANATGSTDEPNDRADVTAAVEVVEVAGVRIAKKTATEAGKEKEEDYERTEISIMEATMDNNEWITDNYQVLPWMNLSVPSVSQDLAQTDQLPTGGCQHSSALADADAAPPTEVEQTGALPVVEGNAENNNKKVVAVQPMPQSVNVTFRIHYLTRSPYQTVAVTGNQRELGNWKDFVPLERAKDGHWAAAVSLPAESHVEWKFVLAEKGEVCRWEECGNRLLDTGCGDDLTVHKWWGLL
uniref:Starch-binding domain-containing protein 1 n=1 Tax=Scophthalmus maximus TaxID=52904 RepID=A0A8D3DTS1_SCOMX